MIDDAGSKENPSKVPGEGGTYAQLPTAPGSAGSRVKPVFDRHCDFKTPTERDGSTRSGAPHAQTSRHAAGATKSFDDAYFWCEPVSADSEE
jgi:hypothetical protein